MRILCMVIAICVSSLNAYGHGSSAKHQAKEIAQDIQDRDFQAIAERTDAALDAAIHRACDEMNDEGYNTEASDICNTYDAKYKDYLTKMVGRDDIGDHMELELIPWLSQAYKTIEAKLGHDLCVFLHLDSIYVINETIKMAFTPCTFPMDGVPGPRKDEFARNMVKGVRYNGLYAHLVYWGIDIGCMAGTSGIASFLCGPIASLGELVCSDLICIYVSDAIEDKFCGGGNP